MGLLKSLKKMNLRDAVGGLGDIAKKAAPVIGLVPGVGTVAAGVIGAGGGALGSLNDRNADGSRKKITLKSIALPAAGYGVLGAAGGKLGSMAKAKGGLGALASSATGKARGVLLGSGSAAGVPTGSAAGKAQAVARLAGSGKGLLGRIGNAALKNPELAVAGVGMLNNARNAGRAANRQDEALELARARAAQTSPMMEMAMRRLAELNPNAVPNLGGVFGGGDPYAARA